MTELDEALEAGHEFEAVETGYRLRSATFDATAVPGAETVSVTVEVPTLDAVVEGETVADVVLEGWYETFVKRLDGVSSVSPADVGDPAVESFPETIVVEVEVTPRSGFVVDDVQAVINFIEGTWVGGIIPGYDYVDEIQALRTRAARKGGSEDPTPD